jgi:hypothetical protein
VSVILLVLGKTTGLTISGKAQVRADTIHVILIDPAFTKGDAESVCVCTDARCDLRVTVMFLAVTYSSGLAHDVRSLRAP